MCPTKNIFCNVCFPILQFQLACKFRVCPKNLIQAILEIFACIMFSFCCLSFLEQYVKMPISATNLLLEERTVKDENSFVFLDLPINQNLRDIQILIIVTEFYRYQNLLFTSISSPPFAIFHVVYCHFRSERIIGTRENKSLRNNRDQA